MAARTEQPDDLLTLSEVASMLHVGSTTIRRMIDDGQFPEGVLLTPGTLLWARRDVVTYCEWKALQPRMQVKVKESREPKGKPPDASD